MLQQRTDGMQSFSSLGPQGFQAERLRGQHYHAWWADLLISLVCTPGYTQLLRCPFLLPTHAGTPQLQLETCHKTSAIVYSASIMQHLRFCGDNCRVDGALIALGGAK